MTNYRLIFLWKAQMAAIISPPPYFNTVNGKSLFKSKNHIFFVKKDWIFTQRILKQRHLICYDTALWIESYQQIQNGGHDRPKWCLKKHFKMMFFDCWNACQFYRRVLILEGYCLAAIKDLLWQLMFWWSYNLLLYDVTEHSNSGFELRVFHHCTFCKISTTISTFLQVYLYS